MNVIHVNGVKVFTYPFVLDHESNDGPEYLVYAVVNSIRSKLSSLVKVPRISDIDSQLKDQV